MSKFKQVEIGDSVEDYVYGLGMTYIGNVLSIEDDTVTVSLYVKQTWLDKLLFGTAPTMNNRKVAKSEFYSWNGEVWNLDTFL